MDTYEIRPVRISHLCDVGRVVNPEGAKGQIVGATVQGIGFALTERVEVVADRADSDWGLLSCNSLFNYRIPVSSMIPAIEVEFLSCNEDLSVYLPCPFSF